MKLSFNVLGGSCVKEVGIANRGIKSLSAPKTSHWRLCQRENGLISYWKLQLEKFRILALGERQAIQLHWRGKSKSYVFQKQIFFFQLSCC
jgi:hypothetical protein